MGMNAFVDHCILRPDNLDVAKLSRRSKKEHFLHSDAVRLSLTRIADTQARRGKSFHFANIKIIQLIHTITRTDTCVHKARLMNGRKCMQWA